MKKYQKINIKSYKKIFKEDDQKDYCSECEHKLQEDGKCPKSGCTKQVDGKWRIISNKDGHLWPQKYNTREDAVSALQAYHVHH